MSTPTALDGAYSLHDYQAVARDFLIGRSGAALFLEMGLGKTAATATALDASKGQTLVIAPKRVAEYVWPAELERWRPDLSYALAVGGPAPRRRALTSGADVVIIGRDVLADAATSWSPRWHTVVIDELSGFKNRATRRWKTARKICRDADRVWGLTGTPSPNGLMDLWAQIALLDGGEALGSTLTGFRARYYTPGSRLPNGIITRWDLRPGADAAILKKLEPIALSMTTDSRITLPQVTYNTVEVPLDPKTRKLYDQLRQDLVVKVQDIEDLLGRPVTHSATSAAILTNRLSQVTAGFLYPDTDAHLDDTDASSDPTPLHTAKVDALQEIIDGTGSPVLVFYRYIEEARRIMRAVPGARMVTERGAVTDWNAGKISVLLAHPASAGHGLNLQHGGHTIVWSSPTWSLEEYQQGNARLARQGQTHPVVIHHLVSPNTIDVAQLARLSGKADAQAAVMDHLECGV